MFAAVGDEATHDGSKFRRGGPAPAGLSAEILEAVKSRPPRLGHCHMLVSCHSLGNQDGDAAGDRGDYLGEERANLPEKLVRDGGA